jgi:hypothetical protein
MPHATVRLAGSTLWMVAVLLMLGSMVGLGVSALRHWSRQQ